jgi:hypothetical protein
LASVTGSTHRRPNYSWSVPAPSHRILP